MKVGFKRSFVKDLRRVRDKGLEARVKTAIETVEQAQNLQEIQDIKKLRSGDRYYRIRIADYRVGLVLEGDTVILAIRQEKPFHREGLRLKGSWS